MIRRIIFAAAGLALVTAGPTFSAETGATAGADATIGVPAVDVSGSMQAAGAQGGQASEPALDLRASQMVGQEIHSTAGNTLGTVSEVLVGPEGEAKIVIETAGDLQDLGVEKKTIVVPAGQVSYAPVSDELVYTESVASLQQAPEWLQD